jgi:competence protein ComEA
MKSIRNLILGLIILFSPLCFAEPVDINSADASVLAKKINGVGPDRAQAIIDYRNEHGPFGSVEDLALVQGIGFKIVAKNRDKLSTGKKLYK